MTRLGMSPPVAPILLGGLRAIQFGPHAREAVLSQLHAIRPGLALDAALRRVLDVVGALIGLVFLAPLLLLVALAVKLDSRGPVIFAQERLGRESHPFRCFKFRTMRPDAQELLERLLASSSEARREWELNHKLEHDPRITRLGSFLRSSSIDELPQLFNVLRGEMSLVGPRPIVRDEVYRYGRFFSYYRAVRPGMTGVWQVSGRSQVAYGRRVIMDVLYARRRSLGLNLRVLAATIPAVLTRRGSC